MKRSWLLAAIGLVLVVLGGVLANAIQTAGGVKISDVRIPLEDGHVISALVYRPPNATVESPAPGVLATHGYINSRETQSPFAIELARRGYVVVAIDQSGHGFSNNKAFANGFGGPAGLAYLRALPYVDPARIGLQGHSMGGWTSLAAATALPDAYKSIALVGSSTGAPFSAPGTATWPRNLAVVFSRFDEFSGLMWGVPKAKDAPDSKKLKAAFGVETTIEPGRVYGDVASGTARRLTQPNTTHPGDPLSHEAVADVISWEALTLGQPVDLPATNQIWHWKEIGTLIALVGAATLVLGVFALMTPSPQRAAADSPPTDVSGRARFSQPLWIAGLIIAIAVPALIYFPATELGSKFTGLALFPQNITNQIVAWALASCLIPAISLLASRRFGFRAPVRAILASLAAVAATYAAVALSGLLLHTDMRFWIVALKPMGAHHITAFLAYLPIFLIYFYLSFAALQHILLRGAQSTAAQYAIGWLASAAGISLLMGFAYFTLFATGALPEGFDPLFSIVGLQFVPVLTLTGVIAVFTWRRTYATFPGALMAALLITWYVVAGQATHA
jgi:dienelactone hydrolase